jgi:VanZ family protein
MRLNLRYTLIAWGPAVILMALMFYFSAQPKTAPPAGADNVYFSGMMPIFTGRGWEVLIKKSSHVVAYGLLSVLIWRGLRAQGFAPREATSWAILLTISFALTDELHQSFVLGRHASIIDIGFDYIGAASAALLSRKYLNGTQIHTDGHR